MLCESEIHQGSSSEIHEEGSHLMELRQRVPLGGYKREGKGHSPDQSSIGGRQGVMGGWSACFDGMWCSTLGRFEGQAGP